MIIQWSLNDRVKQFSWKKKLPKNYKFEQFFNHSVFVSGHKSLQENVPSWVKPHRCQNLLITFENLVVFLPVDFLVCSVIIILIKFIYGKTKQFHIVNDLYFKLHKKNKYILFRNVHKQLLIKTKYIFAR